MEEREFYQYGNIKVGCGNFDLPPILIGTMFYQNQTLIDRKNEKIFDVQKAKKRIQNHIDLAEKYKLPAMIEISASTPEAMEIYLDFYLTNYSTPFILGGTLEARLAGLKYLHDNNVKNSEFIYNAISNLKNRQEVKALQTYKVRTVVVLILGSPNMTSTQRFSYLMDKNQPENINIIEGLKKIGINEIWVDGGVINLESLAHIIETQQIISTSLKIPVGTAPNLFLFKYSSPRLNKRFHTRYRRASIMFIASWFSNFIFYGAIEDAKECFASTYQSFEFKKIIKNNKIKLWNNI